MIWVVGDVVGGVVPTCIIYIFIHKRCYRRRHFVSVSFFFSFFAIRNGFRPGLRSSPKLSLIQKLRYNYEMLSPCKTNASDASLTAMSNDPFK